MPNMYTNNPEYLMKVIQELVSIIKLENGNLYQLLKNSTLDNQAIIQIDEVKIRLIGNHENDYTLIQQEVLTNEPPVFICRSNLFSKILEGYTNIDHALVNSHIHVQGNFEDALNIYRLAKGILTEASISPAIRALWKEFERNWIGKNPNTKLLPITSQTPDASIFIKNIPKKVLKVIF